MKESGKLSRFAATLKALREQAGLSQRQLAERAGMHQFGVAKLEQGIRDPSWATVQALSQALGVNCLAFSDGEPLPEGAAVKPKPGRPRKTAEVPTRLPGAQTETKKPQGKRPTK